MTTPWTDDRLRAAFDARARLDGPTPVDLTPRVLTAIAAESAAPAQPAWRRFLPLAAVAAVVLAIGGILIAPRLLSDRAVSSGVSFRPGPSGDLRTLVTDEFTLDFPASWFAADSSVTFPNMSSIAVLDSVPIDPSCGTASHVDIRCVNAHPLVDGETRVLVGTADYLQGTVLDRPNLDFGTTTRLTVDGYPALLDETVPSDADLNGADLTQHLYIARPSGPSHVVTLDLIARGDPPGDQADLDIARSQMEAMIASFDYTAPGPATAPPSDSPAPSTASTAFGLPIIDVSAALTVQGGVDDRELAVRGWFSPWPPVPCPFEPTTVTLQARCPDEYIQLLDAPETLFTEDGTGGSVGDAPTGPAFQLDFDGVDSTALPNATGTRGSKPAEVVVIGHFDDRRNSFCPPDQRQACRDRFVVDRIDQIAGVTQPTSFVDSAGGSHQTSPDDALAVALGQSRPGAQVLSTDVIGIDQIDQIEPGIRDCPSGVYCALQPPAYWIVRILDDGRLRTFGLFDGGEQAFELTAEGVRPIPAPTASASTSAPTAASWPPTEASVVTLTSPVGAGRDPVQVAVIDRSGRLVDAADAPGDPPALANPDIGSLVEVGPSTYRLDWIGDPCDDRFDVTVFSDLHTIEIGSVSHACDAIAIGRAITLRFDQPIDATGVNIQFRHDDGP